MKFFLTTIASISFVVVNGSTGKCSVKPGFEAFEVYCSQTESTCKAFAAFCDWAQEVAVVSKQEKSGYCSAQDSMIAFQVYCDGVVNDKQGCNNYAAFCRWVDGSDAEKPLEEISNTKTDTTTDTIIGKEKINPKATKYCPAKESLLILTDKELYYRTPEGYGNVALGAKVTASSNYNSGRKHSQLTDGDKSDNNFAHTECSPGTHYFEVDLGNEFYIDHLKLFERTDSPSLASRTTGFTVEFMDKSRTLTQEWEDDSTATLNLVHDKKFVNPILTQFIRVRSRNSKENLCFHFQELEAYGEIDSQLEMCSDGFTGARDLVKTDKFIYVVDEMGNSVYRIAGLCGEKKTILSQSDGTWVQQPRAIAVKEKTGGASVIFVSMMQPDIGWAAAKNPELSQHRQVYYMEMNANGDVVESGILGNSNNHGVITALDFDSDSNVLWGVSENKYVVKYVNGEWVKLNENSQVVDMRQIDSSLHGQCQRSYYAGDDNNAIFSCVDPAKPETCSMQCPSTVMNPWAVEAGVDCSIYTGSTGSIDGSNYEIIKYDENLCGKAFVIETVTAPVFDIVAFEDDNLNNLCVQEQDEEVECGVCDYLPKTCEEKQQCTLGLVRSDAALCGDDGVDCGKDICCTPAQCDGSCGAKYEPSGDKFCYANGCENCCDLVQLPCSSNSECQAGEVKSGEQFCGGEDDRDCSVCCEPIKCDTYQCSPGYKLDEEVLVCDADGCENCCTTFCAINTIRQGDKCLPRTTPSIYFPPHTKCADLRRSGTDANVKGKTINGVTFDTVEPTENGIYVIIQDANINGGQKRYAGGAYNNGCLGFSGYGFSEDTPSRNAGNQISGELKFTFDELQSHVFLTVADMGDFNPNKYDDTLPVAILQGFDQNDVLVAEDTMILGDPLYRDACTAAANGGGSGSYVFSLDYPPGIKYVQVKNPNQYIFDPKSAWSDICGAKAEEIPTIIRNSGRVS
eukprot:Awhi_evm1s14650